MRLYRKFSTSIFILLLISICIAALGMRGFGAFDYLRVASIEKRETKYEVREIPITISGTKSKYIVEDKKIYEDILHNYLKTTLNVSNIEVICVYRLKEKPELGEALVKVGDAYYLVRLNGNKPIAHIHLKPVLIKKETGEEEITSPSIPEKASGPYANITVVKLVKSYTYEVYELKLEQGEFVQLATIYAVTVDKGIEGKNVFGWTIWHLSAKSTTYILDWVLVISVDDQSYYWIALWAQWAWSCQNFNHYAEVRAQGLYSYTWAEADFIYAPFGVVLQRIHAWSWIRVWFDGTVEADSGA
ncbi:MAG: hypothetical protein MRT15_06625 [archaeon YNP-LCB-003-016]|uniref:hypothetical protein n=1 Tax=Candidatus Culexarchaeum yellowstonense TaxID=2928963 RepID=UPI0026F29717|nr:hypothetical protein [Candidatus Culexarchaeum yellowstonense]MCR6692045.1 hypothetical protein [Candidatus Culexarchaeum yellowstonense]